MKKFSFAFLVVLLIMTVTPTLAQGELPELRIRLNRNFGYGGFDNKIEGRFSIHVRDADGFESVAFYIDDKIIETRNAAPYSTDFHTENYSAGSHLIYAIGSTSSGSEIRSNEFNRVFISSDEVGSIVVGMLVPIIAILVLAFAVSTFLPGLLGRKQTFTLGQYSTAGGAVCKNCAKPFGRKLMSPNMMVGKLERCPHCGKWQIASRAAEDELSAAEKHLSSDEAPSPQSESDEDKLKHQIDDSRFD
jgi:hypothetical protein